MDYNYRLQCLIVGDMNPLPQCDMSACYSVIETEPLSHGVKYILQ